MPVNSLTTTSNSGKALMKISISFSYEIPSYNPSLALTSENLATAKLTAISTSFAKLLFTTFNPCTNVNTSSITAKSNSTDLTSVNACSASPDSRTRSTNANNVLMSSIASSLVIFSIYSANSGTFSTNTSLTNPKL